MKEFTPRVTIAYMNCFAKKHYYNPGFSAGLYLVKNLQSPKELDRLILLFDQRGYTARR